MKKTITLFAISLILSMNYTPSFSQTQLGEDINGEDVFDQSSMVSISADGSRLIIGAPFQGFGTINGENGYARVFEWDGSNWIQKGAPIYGVAYRDQCGWSVSISADGNRVAVGSPLNDNGGESAGHVRIFDWWGGGWSQAGADIDGDPEGIGGTYWGGFGGDLPGGLVSLSADGNRVAIGIRLIAGASGRVEVWDLSLVSPTSFVDQSGIEIFPNPTSGNIQLTGVEHGTVSFADSFGRILLEKEVTEPEIDISQLPGGIYFMLLRSGEQYYSGRIIKN